MLDIWEIAKRVTPRQLGMATVAVATVAAVAVSHLLWYLHSGEVPAGLTVVAGGAAIVVALPMTWMFVIAIYRLERANSRLLETKTSLSLRRDELEAARSDLRRLNDRLESRVAERTADLETALRDAEMANAAKSTFLANMSHELRTPLNGIIGYAELIVNRRSLIADAADDVIDGYAEAIHSSGLHLSSMVEDLLDLSRIEADELEINPSSMTLQELLSQVRQDLDCVAVKRRQQIETRIAPGLPPLTTDQRAARQILTNLLSNALKYSGEGDTVEIDAFLDGDRLVVDVHDRGIGMSPDEVERATEPFSRFSNAHIASGKSVGLGLSITKRLCGMLGGRFELRSQAGTGTTARVSFPVAAIHEERTALAG